MPDDPVEDPKAELALVERELGQVAKDAEELRQELGSRADGPGDPVDNTTLIEQLNLTESLLEDLKRRQADLRVRVGSSEVAGEESASGE